MRESSREDGQNLSISLSRLTDDPVQGAYPFLVGER